MMMRTINGRCALALAAAAADSLPLPKSVVIDRSIPTPQREAMTLAARRYFAFWDTGELQAVAPLLGDEARLHPETRAISVFRDGAFT